MDENWMGLFIIGRSRVLKTSSASFKSAQRQFVPVLQMINHAIAAAKPATTSVK
jgi:hypothetical protein